MQDYHPTANVFQRIKVYFCNHQTFPPRTICNIWCIIYTILYKLISQVIQLKHSAVELLEVMCEETHPEAEKLVRNVFRTIDLDALQGTLVYFFKLIKDPVLVRHQKSPDCV